MTIKILHLCLSNFYIDGYTYQENILPRINHEDGHEVKILASTETYADNQHLSYIEPSEYGTEYGVPMKRLPYVKVGNHFTTTKFRAYPHLYEEIASFSPDVIMIHDVAFWSVLDVIRYKKAHPEVKLYADTHTAYNNSGTNWLSLHILHRIYYRWLTKKVFPYLEQYFYISDECRQFSHEVYDIPNEKMEFYPLGGILPTEAEYARHRKVRREELGVTDSDRLYVHSGKLDALKRTEELLKAFSAVKDDHATLAIIGSIPEEMKPVLLPLIEADKRVKYLGWKTGAELQEYLCAGDLYCQPGGQSSTMQNALCNFCPVMLYPHPSHTADYDCGEVLWVKTQADMEAAFRSLADDPAQLASLRENAVKIARELLDYRKLAARLYE